MSGLRKAILERTQAQPRSDAELLQAFDHFAKGGRIRKYGYGGDVDGKDAEGVGDSGGYGGSASDWSGWSGPDMGGAGLGNSMDGVSFDGGRDSGDRGGGFDFNSIAGDSSVNWGKEFEGATLPGDLSSDYLGGAYDSYMDHGDVGSIGSMATSPVGWADFGAMTLDGALPGNLSYQGSGLGRAATSDLNLAPEDLAYEDAPTTPRTPTEGTMRAIALDSLVDAIRGIESQGKQDPYSAVGKKDPKSGDRAYGISQVMGNNVPSWSKEYFGERLSPKSYLNNDDAQIAVTYGRLGDLMDKYGPVGAARAWYGGEAGMKYGDRTDAHGRLSIDDYGNEIAQALGLTANPSSLPASAPTPPARPEEPMGPQMWEGDPLATGRIQSLEQGHLPGITYGNQDAINASLMGELTGPQAQVRADETDKRGRERTAAAQDAVPAPAATETAAKSPNAFSDLSFELATGMPDASLDFGFGDGFGRATAAATSGKAQDRVAERTDLPQLTSDVNAPARAAMGDINARPVDPNAPRPETPATPGNAIADAITRFFEGDRPAPVQAAAPKAMAGDDFEAAFRAEQTPGSMAALTAQPAAPVVAQAALPQGDVLAPEEEAAAPNRAQPGVQTASNAPVAPSAPSAPARSPARAEAARGASPAASARAATSDEVYSPVMPGMAPGMTSYPERGVINQPSTAFHEKIAERAGSGLARAVGSAMTGGVFGLADMASGYFGGPSTGGFFANSTPGMDLSKGWEEPGDHDPRDSRPPAAPTSTTPEPPPKPASTGTGGKAQTDSSFGRRTYLGPPLDPLHYGYGSERTYFKYRRGGSVDCAPPQGALSRGMTKRGR